MPQILTTNALIVCPHGGKGTTVPSSQKWQINGAFVCVENDTGTLACPFVPLPCGGYQLQSMGLNASQLDDKKVMLVTDFNKTFTGLPLVMTEFHQAVDQSTLAPIPAGQPAPPLSPEMADLVPPTVSPSVQTFPFKISPPPAPVPVVVTFNLTTDHPLIWILTLINTTLGKHLDLTNGLPGATVSPSGGKWSSSSLTVTVTMTPDFLKALTPSAKGHELFMTGVSKRGLSGHGKAILTVTP
jgi:hypothetical protein